MYKHVLIATDGSELAAKAVTTGLELAKALGAKVTVVTATEPWTTMVTGEPAFVFPVEEYEQAAADKAARILVAVGALARERGVACEAVHVQDFPAEGSHGQGMRPHHNVVTRTPRSCESAARQPSLERTDALDDPRAHLPLTRRVGQRLAA